MSYQLNEVQQQFPHFICWRSIAYKANLDLDFLIDYSMELSKFKTELLMNESLSDEIKDQIRADD